MLPQDMVGQWSTAAIHDTVAAIARLPEYATPLRRSILGRAFGYLIEKFAQLLDLFRGSRDLRIAAIAAIALIVLAVVGRMIVARQIDVVGKGSRLRSGVGRGDQRDYWSVSQQLAGTGDYAGAAHALYAAVIDTLVRGGSVTFHASKTSGDYARDLRRHGSPALHDFRAFARHFDQAVYGTTPVTGTDYERLAEIARRVSASRTAA